MNNDDKQFFTGLISGMDQKWDRRFGRQMTLMDQKWDRRFEKLRIELKEDIRHNGVMIENLQGLIQSVAENMIGLDHRLTRAEEALEV